MARTAAPPKKAPKATAPVFIGAALVTVEACELAALVAELTRELTELVREFRADVIEARSEPVAVDRAFEYEEIRLPASLVTELTSEAAEELMDESTELARDWAELERDSAEETELARLAVSVAVVTVTTVWACMLVSIDHQDLNGAHHTETIEARAATKIV